MLLALFCLHCAKSRGSYAVLAQNTICRIIRACCAILFAQIFICAVFYAFSISGRWCYRVLLHSVSQGRGLQPGSQLNMDDAIDGAVNDLYEGVNERQDEDDERV